MNWLCGRGEGREAVMRKDGGLEGKEVKRWKRKSGWTAEGKDERLCKERDAGRMQGEGGEGGAAHGWREQVRRGGGKDAARKEGKREWFFFFSRSTGHDVGLWTENVKLKVV